MSTLERVCVSQLNFLKNVKYRFFSFFVGSFSRPSCFSVSWSTCIFWSFFLGGVEGAGLHIHTLGYIIHCRESISTIMSVKSDIFRSIERIYFTVLCPELLSLRVQRVRHGPRSARLDFLCSISAAVPRSFPVPAGHALIRDYCPVF
jgi:hypothetical protein